ARARRSLDHRVMSTPSSVTRPPRTGIRPMIAFSSVVFPTPFRPMRQTTLFAGTARSTLHSTWDSPYAASSFSTASMRRFFSLTQVDLQHARVGLDLLDGALAQHHPLMEHGHLAGDLAHEHHVVLDDEHRAISRDGLQQLA